MTWFWPTIAIVDLAIILAMIVTILRERKQPVAMIAWILVTILLPFIGAMLYLLIGERRIKRQAGRRRRRRGKIDERLRLRLEAIRDQHATPDSRRMTRRLRSLIRIATEVGDRPPTTGNDVSLYFDADRSFLALSLAIEAARSHIHMEYYIFQPDETGRAMRDLLIRKAREGVRCRLLLDAVGSWSLPSQWVSDLTVAGVEVDFFQPFRLNLGKLNWNCRNHRKITVVDGHTAFMGSKNIGDEYLGSNRKLGPRRDTNLRIIGPAAAHLQEVFVEDWHYTTHQDLSEDESLFSAAQPAGESSVQIFASGPDRPAGALHMLLYTALAAARRSIAIQTPYFVPDAAITLALRSAARRGVQVRLLLPSKSDNWLVLWAGRSYYEELLEAGVSIHEYDAGMLHSKVVVIDGDWSMVSSANMDIRSFQINFELTSILFDPRLSRELLADFEMLIGTARPIKRGESDKWSFGQSLAVGLARLASPML